jgi:hypothetical protein
MDTRLELTERIKWLEHELAKAPVWRKATVWWDDRIRELEACERRLLLREKRYSTTEVS